MLWLWRRFTSRRRLLIAGDIGMLYFVWYGLERSLLEFFRSGYDWTFFGLGTAQIVGIGAAVAAIAVIVVRHRLARGRPPEELVGERSGDVASAAQEGSIVPSDAAAQAAPDVPFAGPADS
jgi:prolipoprotein diacylglyceryltransferase